MRKQQADVGPGYPARMLADVLIVVAGLAIIAAVCAGIIWRYGLWQRTFGTEALAKGHRDRGTRPTLRRPSTGPWRRRPRLQVRAAPVTLGHSRVYGPNPTVGTSERGLQVPMAENRDHSFPLTQQQMEHLAAAVDPRGFPSFYLNASSASWATRVRIVQAVAENEQVVLYAITDDRVVLIKAAPTTRERPEYRGQIIDDPWDFEACTTWSLKHLNRLSVGEVLWGPQPVPGTGLVPHRGPVGAGVRGAIPSAMASQRGERA